MFQKANIFHGKAASEASHWGTRLKQWDFLPSLWIDDLSDFSLYFVSLLICYCHCLFFFFFPSQSLILAISNQHVLLYWARKQRLLQAPRIWKFPFTEFYHFKVRYFDSSTFSSSSKQVSLILLKYWVDVAVSNNF